MFTVSRWGYVCDRLRDQDGGDPFKLRFQWLHDHVGSAAVTVPTSRQGVHDSGCAQAPAE
jgi:hypothetical protein